MAARPAMSHHPGVQTFPRPLLECLSAGLHDQQNKMELTAHDSEAALPCLVLEGARHQAVRTLTPVCGQAPRQRN